MRDIGRICVKTAGRDAGKYCIILQNEDDRVLIDGQTRRRKVNPMHVEPTTKKVEIREEASHDKVKEILQDLNITVGEETIEKPNKSDTKKEMMKYLDYQGVDYSKSMLKDEIYELVKEN